MQARADNSMHTAAASAIRSVRTSASIVCTLRRALAITDGAGIFVRIALNWHGCVCVRTTLPREAAFVSADYNPDAGICLRRDERASPLAVDCYR